MFLPYLRIFLLLFLLYLQIFLLFLLKFSNLPPVPTLLSNLPPPVSTQLINLPLPTLLTNPTRPTTHPVLAAAPPPPATLPSLSFLLLRLPLLLQLPPLPPASTPPSLPFFFPSVRQKDNHMTSEHGKG